ncbi:MAG: phytanoyl-CoA dioxygenase family protein [Proteobacteria bacterium]|nr:phytanoyl-CoA dioxygenase family protein [Pseudomonadota bacterium]
MAKLNTDELEHYENNGYLFPNFKLSDDLVVRLQSGIESAITRLGHQFKPEDIPNPHFLDFSSEGVNNPFLEVASNPDILDMVEQVIGPNIILWISRVFCKPSLTGREVPWHQDGEYWPVRPLETCTVWIALDEVTTENGCMRFIAGSHKAGLYKHHMSDRKDLVLNLELDKDQFDETNAVNVELHPGAISMHHVKLIHGSHANRSPKRRAALVMRYMPGSSHYDRSIVNHDRFKSPFNLTEQPLMLMRGKDVSGKNDLNLHHEYWKQRYSEV